MTTIGTPLTPNSTRLLLLGAGELGKEVAIEAQRYGVEVTAADRYDHAPAMQVAHRSHVLDMRDPAALTGLIEQEQPDLIVPEVEAIATDTLLDLEQQGFRVIPTARATRLTMDREGIRRLAAEELRLKTTPYRFAATREACHAACSEIGLPCVIKPVMSSSGHGQSTVRSRDQIDAAWDFARTDARGGAGKVIVEGFVEFDYEITLLTVRHKDGTSYCAPIGHRQEDGDYRESWQPHPMSEQALEDARFVAGTVTGSLGGHGLFGVELFVSGDEVLFSEVSPRPHDTGMVTLISQDLSEFALHVRAVLGLPIPEIIQRGPCASAVIMAHGESERMRFQRLEKALAEPGTDIRLFGKPEVRGHRRVGVALARGENIESARHKARQAADTVLIEL